MPSHFHPELGISLVTPDGWRVGSTAEFPLFVAAPPERGFRSNLGFSRSKMPARPDIVQRMLQAAREEQARDYPGFVELSANEIQVDDCPGILQTYAWKPADAQEPFHQWFALLLTQDHGLIEVNGATLESLSERVAPRLESVLASVRFIPRST